MRKNTAIFYYYKNCEFLHAHILKHAAVIKNNLKEPTQRF